MKQLEEECTLEKGDNDIRSEWSMMGPRAVVLVTVFCGHHGFLYQPYISTFELPQLGAI